VQVPSKALCHPHAGTISQKFLLLTVLLAFNYRVVPQLLKGCDLFSFQDFIDISISTIDQADQFDLLNPCIEITRSS
jgi:hypothetical protein